MVTGAATGSGRAVAMLFSRAGANVAVVDPDDILGQKVANDLRAAGGEEALFKCEPTNPLEVQNAANATVDRFGTLDAAVNVVTWNSDEPSVFAGDQRDLERALVLRLRSLRNCLKCQTAQMTKQGRGGSITILRQSNALRDPTQSGFDQALIDIARTTAADHKKADIRVNVVLPSRTAALVGHSQSPTDLSRLSHSSALDDPARSCVWLASEAASYVTGSVISSESGFAHAM